LVRMTGRSHAFLIEPDEKSLEWDEVMVDEERMRGLLVGSDPTLSDSEAALALLELLHAELEEMTSDDYGFLDRDQVALAFESLLATARRLGLARAVLPPPTSSSDATLPS